MEKDLKCIQCGHTFHKYDVLYIGGKTICPYCEGDCVDIKLKSNKNNSNKRKSIFNIFK